MSSTTAQVDPEFDRRIALACEYAQRIDDSTRRRAVPVRATFARDRELRKSAPMTRLIAVGGRGGEIPVKLYLALIWRSSVAPFSTSAPARKLAELLALKDPSKNGARRVTDALKTLAEHHLITVEHKRGEPSQVTLLREDGSNQKYSVPRGKDGPYFQIPAEMWTTGQLQRLSAPGLAMLLAMYSEEKYPGADVWWATSQFPGRIGLSPATRARGTTELQAAGLLKVSRQLLARRGSLRTDRVRNIYNLIGDAVRKSAVEAQQDPLAP